jgi:hypothetical protein
MRGDKGLKRFGANKRRIPGQYEGKLRSSQGTPRNLHRMAGAVLRLLQDNLSPEWLDYWGDLFCLVPHNDNCLLGA